MRVPQRHGPQLSGVMTLTIALLLPMRPIVFAAQ
jgi:hypothetical protein